VKISKDEKMYTMDISSTGDISKLKSFTDGTGINAVAQQ
jgi:hypothetical protein